MTKQELLQIINKHVGYSESEIYEAVDEYKPEKMYNKQEISEIIEEYDSYSWSENSFAGKDHISFSEWFDKYK